MSRRGLESVSDPDPLPGFHHEGKKWRDLLFLLSSGSGAFSCVAMSVVLGLIRLVPDKGVEVDAGCNNNLRVLRTDPQKRAHLFSGLLTRRYAIQKANVTKSCKSEEPKPVDTLP